MPAEWRKYIMPPYRDEEHARKAKARIFGKQLGDAVVDYAKAIARGHNRKAESILEAVKPKKRHYVVQHANDVLPVFQKGSR